MRIVEVVGSHTGLALGTNVLVAGETGRDAGLTSEGVDISVVSIGASESTAVCGVEVEAVEAAQTLQIGKTGQARPQTNLTGIAKIIRVIPRRTRSQAAAVIEIRGGDATETGYVRSASRAWKAALDAVLMQVVGVGC